jgi:CheY-like chemotaxis protein
MAHGLASQLGGALTIDSRPGEGARIEIWLPQSFDPLMCNRGAPETDTASAGAALVLLVDDEALIRQITTEMLTELGFRVHGAGSAEAALSVVDAGLKPDILVTDHMMPGMTGIELAYAVKARQPSARALIISGFAEVDTLDPALPRLTKPFVQSELAFALANILSSAKADRE